MPAEFIYRGKNLEELKKLDIREFAKYVKSRERRAVLRQFDKIERFVNKCRGLEKKNKPIRTHSRELVIVPGMIDSEIYIHNGKEFVKVKILPDMLGHRLGEFAQTRRKVEHGAPGIGATRSSASLSVK